MRKGLLLALSFFFSFYAANAQKPDSVYVGTSYIQFIFLTDSTPMVKEFIFDKSMELEIVEKHPAEEADLKIWKKNTDCVFAYHDLDSHVDFNSLLVGNQLSHYIFFAPDRYVVMNEDGDTYKNGHEQREFVRCETNNWKQYTIEGLNVLLLFDTRRAMKYRDDIELECFILPLKKERYYVSRGDLIEVLKPDTLEGNYNHLLWSRQHIYDVDTFSVKGKYGLYTLTRKKVIPAVYDSIQTDEMYVRAFRGKKTVIFDYMGNVVKKNIKRAYPFLYRYQVLDDKNQVYWMDRDGNAHDKYTYSLMSVDDMLYPLPDVILNPSPKEDRSTDYYLVRFKLMNSFEERDKHEEKYHRDMKLMDMMYKSGVSMMLSGNRYLPYGFEIYEVSSKYKKGVLINGEEELSLSGDYKSLNEYWIIAKFKGKYGVINAKSPDTPVLPFIYDKIEPHTTYLTLYKKGMVCHYPISDTPRYKELAPLHLREHYTRFTLPDGKKGWLLKNGEEFLDPK